MLPVEIQAERFLTAFLLGACAAAWVDISSGLIRGSRLRRIFIPFVDFFFWLVLTGGVLFVLEDRLHLAFRFYVIMAVGMGVLGYRLLAAPAVSPLLVSLFGWPRRLSRRRPPGGGGAAARSKRRRSE